MAIVLAPWSGARMERIYFVALNLEDWCSLM